MAKFVWEPSEERVERANVTRLRRRLGCGDYHELHRLSVDDPDAFWRAVVDDLGLEFSEPWRAVLDVSDGPEWAKWFVGGTTNVAWNCVHKWARSEDADRLASAFSTMAKALRESFDGSSVSGSAGGGGEGGSGGD